MDTSVANNGEFVVTPRQYNRYNMFGDAEYRGEEVVFRGGHNGGAGGAQATPGILIFQKQVTLFTKSGDTLDLE